MGRRTPTGRQEERAGAVAKLGKRMLERFRRREQPERRQRDGERSETKLRENAERHVAEEQLEVIQLAIQALLEAERRDTADVLRREVLVRQARLERREVGITAPRRAAVVEGLALASRLWREFGQEKNARR